MIYSDSVNGTLMINPVYDVCQDYSSELNETRFNSMYKEKRYACHTHTVILILFLSSFLESFCRFREARQEHGGESSKSECALYFECILLSEKFLSLLSLFLFFFFAIHRLAAREKDKRLSYTLLMRSLLYQSVNFCRQQMANGKD